MYVRLPNEEMTDEFQESKHEIKSSDRDGSSRYVCRREAIDGLRGKTMRGGFDEKVRGVSNGNLKKRFERLNDKIGKRYKRVY